MSAIRLPTKFMDVTSSMRKNWPDVFNVYSNAVCANFLEFLPSMPLLGLSVFFFRVNILLQF